MLKDQQYYGSSEVYILPRTDLLLENGYMDWRQIRQWMDYLDSCVGNVSSGSVILISIWSWIKPFAPINSRQGTKNQILIFVLAKHRTDKPYIVF